MRGMMSSEEYLRRMGDPKWYGEQDENGVDLSLIRENLKLTPKERLRQGDDARASALELLEIGRRNRLARPTVRGFESENAIAADEEIDLSEADWKAIRENLRLTPERRILKADLAREAAVAKSDTNREMENG
jgi:hypothetical protein